MNKTVLLFGLWIVALVTALAIVDIAITLRLISTTECLVDKPHIISEELFQ